MCQCWVHIEEMRGDQLLILVGDHMYWMDYWSLLKEYFEVDVDIIVVVQFCSAVEIGGFGALWMDVTGRVEVFCEKSGILEVQVGMVLDLGWLVERGHSIEYSYLVSMGIYIFKKVVLVVALVGGAIDFGCDVFFAVVRVGQYVQSYFFIGYWCDIGTIGAFY